MYRQKQFLVGILWIFAGIIAIIYPKDVSLRAGICFLLIGILFIVYAIYCIVKGKNKPFE